jgi:hypothetical protein
MAPVQRDGVAPGTTNLTIRMEAGLSIAGQIVDVDGKPFTAAWINASPEGDGKGAPMMQGGYSQVQSDGTFRLDGLRPGTYRINVQRQDGGASPEPVRATAPTTGLRIQMPRGERIGGRLSGSGDLAGFQVMAFPDGNPNSSWRHVIASSDGSFTLEGIGSGTFTVMARKDSEDRYGYATGVAPGTTNLSLELQRGSSIEGVVESDDTVKPERTFVNLVGASWRSWARPAADGSFVLRGLPPGRYHLTVHGENATAEEKDVAAGTTGVRLRLTRRN